MFYVCCRYHGSVSTQRLSADRQRQFTSDVSKCTGLWLVCSYRTNDTTTTTTRLLLIIIIIIIIVVVRIISYTANGVIAPLQIITKMKHLYTYLHNNYIKLSLSQKNSYLLRSFDCILFLN